MSMKSRTAVGIAGISDSAESESSVLPRAGSMCKCVPSAVRRVCSPRLGTRRRMHGHQQHMARANEILVLVEQKLKLYWIEVAFPNERYLR